MFRPEVSPAEGLGGPEGAAPPLLLERARPASPPLLPKAPKAPGSEPALDMAALLPRRLPALMSGAPALLVLVLVRMLRHKATKVFSG